MPRPEKAKKISDKIMKKAGALQEEKPDRRQNGENQFERNIRMTIKR